MKIHDEQAVSNVTERISTEPDLSDRELSEKLLSEGYPLNLAERVIAFIPLAFERLYFGEASAEFQNQFEIRDLGTGRNFAWTLTEESIYGLAVAPANAWKAERNQSDFQCVARRSAEFEAVLHLSRDGSDPSDVFWLNRCFSGSHFPESMRRITHRSGRRLDEV